MRNYNVKPHLKRIIGHKYFIIPVFDEMPDMSQALFMNITAREILEFLEQDYSIADILNILSNKYSVEKETLINDVNNVLENLIKSGIIEVAE